MPFDHRQWSFNAGTFKVPVKHFFNFFLLFVYISFHFFSLKRTLTKLNIENLKNVQNLEYIAILLEDLNKRLVIEGCDHLSEAPLKKLENQMQEKDAFAKS